MRRSGRIRRDKDGVSPVIAVILMVAITVVPAAVLYVMVTGLIGGQKVGNPVVTLSPRTGGGIAEVHVAGVDPLEDVDPGVVTQTPVELAAADVQRDDPQGTGVQQELGEASRRGPDVQCVLLPCGDAESR